LKAKNNLKLKHKRYIVLVDMARPAKKSTSKVQRSRLVPQTQASRTVWLVVALVMVAVGVWFTVSSFAAVINPSAVDGGREVASALGPDGTTAAAKAAAVGTPGDGHWYNLKFLMTMTFCSLALLVGAIGITSYFRSKSQ
jgi:hypothetical protein